MFCQRSSPSVYARIHFLRRHGHCHSKGERGQCALPLQGYSQWLLLSKNSEYMIATYLLRTQLKKCVNHNSRRSPVLSWSSIGHKLHWRKQLLRRTFSTSTTTKQARRRKKSLEEKVKHNNSTTRDRLRRIVTKNQIEKSRLLSARQFNDMLLVAKGRLSWVRDKLYQYWNPDYLETTGTAAESAISARPRPPKTGLIMDARWWFWNLLFAMAPGAMIALYCELRGKHLAQSYFQKQELEQAKRLMGEDFVLEHADEILAQSEPPVPDGFAESMRRGFRELQILLVNVVGDLDTNGQPLQRQPKEQAQQEKIKTKDIVISKTTEPRNLSSKSSISAQVSAPVSAKPATLAEVEKSDAGGTKASTASSLNETTPAATTSMESLLQRIKQLEQVVQKQEDDRQRSFQSKLNRLKQSGIQRRVEDKMLDTWETQTTATNNSRSASTTSEKAEVWTKDSNYRNDNTEPNTVQRVPSDAQEESPQNRQTRTTWGNTFSTMKKSLLSLFLEQEAGIAKQTGLGNDDVGDKEQKGDSDNNVDTQKITKRTPKANDSSAFPSPSTCAEQTPTAKTESMPAEKNAMTRTPTGKEIKNWWRLW